jgi:putative colanic acid biosynthesis glycosyltransferase
MKDAGGYRVELVSVVTICYEEQPCKIRSTLDSILGQDYPDVELVLIDGGSGQETLRAFDVYRDRIDCLLSEPDRGIFDAMNKGLAAARGEWVCFMNVGDRFAAPDALRTLVNPGSAGADIVYGDPFTDDEGLLRSPARIDRYTLFHRGICHQALVARRSLFHRIGGFDASLKLGGDPDWLIRAHASGAVFHYVPAVVCRYEGGGASSDYRERQRFRDQVTKRHYRLSERLLFAVILFFHRIARRIVTSNFRVPVAIRDLLKPRQIP